MRTWLIVAAATLALALAGCIGAEDVEDIGSSSNDDTDQPPNPDEPEPTVEEDREFGPWPALEEAKIRPGTNIVSGACTSNFLFRTPDNRTLFLGTAAHCVDDKAIGDDVQVADGVATGQLAYSSFHAMNDTGDDIAGNDFALVALPDSARATIHPAMITFGGPTGIATDVVQGDKLLAHGNSSLRPDAVPDRAGPREGYVTHHDEWTTGMYFEGPGIPGDSGSGVMTADGAALGDVITVELAPEPASNNAANLAATLPYANDYLGYEVELVTWPMQDEGQLPAMS
jgi:hypothetical protein